MKTTHSKFEVSNYLKHDATIAAYLDACLQEGGPKLLAKAVGEVARARGMSEVADSSGVTRASLYKSLAEGGNPALGTMDKVINSLGFRFSITPKARLGSGASARRKATGPVASAPRVPAAARKVAVGKVAMKKSAAIKSTVKVAAKKV